MKKTPNDAVTPQRRICFHLWCEMTLALWGHSIVGVFFHEIKCNRMTSFMEFVFNASYRFVCRFGEAFTRNSHRILASTSATLWNVMTEQWLSWEHGDSVRYGRPY